ncbi:unnamed protein product [Lepeophtheirus salmonis]|uniref:(salmon louse) hypothetical protein n=1 Tax=Lepeophtheirus salmonis TaxID=72036 RepID=A0A7R8CIY3_LEPSM|nr:unnamed protein product [Lepeophtheirus salmonis]CAF2830615.1 unnamed protein product [Lepeophtheirus salmonis]
MVFYKTKNPNFSRQKNRCKTFKSKMDWVAISPSSDMESILELGAIFIGEQISLVIMMHKRKTIWIQISFPSSMHILKKIYFIYEAMIKVLSELTKPIEDYVDVFNNSNESNQYLDGNSDLNDSYEDNESNSSSSQEDISMNEDSLDSNTEKKTEVKQNLDNYILTIAEETVKEMVNYWISALPGDTKIDCEVSTGSSSNDNDQSVPTNKRKTIGPDRTVNDYLEVELPVIEPVFSPEIMSYIVFEGLQTFENLEIESKSHMYNDTVVQKARASYSLVESSDIFINEHLDQFATVEVMRQYGYCLETFESNTVSLNEGYFYDDALCFPKVKPTLAKNYTSSDATRSLIAELDSQRGESESGQDNSPIVDENVEFTSTPFSEKVYMEEIEGIKDLLLIQGKEYLIHWLQEEIVNVILVKTHEKSKSSVKWEKGVLEPIAYYSVFWNEGIPLVPWSIKEESGLQKNYFLMLLKKIGIYLPADRQTRFPRIPNDWSIDHLLNIHKKLACSHDVTTDGKFAHANKQIANFTKPKLQNRKIWNKENL